MTESCGAACPPAIVPQGTVTKRYKALAPVSRAGTATPDRCPLRHWLRKPAAWEALAGAGLTHPPRVAAAARRAGMRPHWRGRVRVWSWAELQRLADLQAARRTACEGADPLARLAASLRLQEVAQ